MGPRRVFRAIALLRRTGTAVRCSARSIRAIDCTRQLSRHGAVAHALHHDAHAQRAKRHDVFKQRQHAPVVLWRSGSRACANHESSKHGEHAWNVHGYVNVDYLLNALQLASPNHPPTEQRRQAFLSSGARRGRCTCLDRHHQQHDVCHFPVGKTWKGPHSHRLSQGQRRRQQFVHDGKTCLESVVLDCYKVPVGCIGLYIGVYIGVCVCLCAW